MAVKQTWPALPSLGGQGTSKKAKQPAAQNRDNLLEGLRGIGASGLTSLKKDIGQGIPEEFFRQMLGIEKPRARASGDIKPGQSIELSAAIEEQKEENKVLRMKLAQEQRLRSEDKNLFTQRTQELKMELHALSQETLKLAQSTQGLSQEVEVAAMQAPANPGVYHVNFFEQLRNFIASFRKDIENTSLWIRALNTRSAKRQTFWGQVGQSGSKRLLSPEDYLQRSAG